MIDETHRDEDFSERRISHWTVGVSTFERCRFDNVRADVAELGVGSAPTVFRDCSFDGSGFARTSLDQVRFERCTFRNVVMRDWIAPYGDFVDCIFGGEFPGLTVFGSSPERSNEVAGNDFRDAVMLGGGFRAGVDLSLQQLPIDLRHVFISDPAVTLPAALTVVRTWGDQAERVSAESVLLVLDEDYRGGQPQLLLCPAAQDAIDEAANARLLEMVRKLVTRGSG
ncbi:pentapeptide repeat-containing protein [Spirilliplanes yamanashiensis]|nr:pentapeptide repeat-containing protein [Spirilliplanes yamanashiensis]MDP9815236.1 hypothetical protein [Spirilliplanes yamanashiensis]